MSKVVTGSLAYTQTGTPYYASPEVWRDEPYDSKSDIWSLGCIVFEMAALRLFEVMEEEFEACMAFIELLEIYIGKLGEDKQIEKNVLLAWALENIVYRYSEAESYSFIAQEHPSIAGHIKANPAVVEVYRSTLKQFLLRYKDSLDEGTTFQILRSHGKFKECLMFAENLGKYETLILNYINEKDFP